MSAIQQNSPLGAPTLVGATPTDDRTKVVLPAASLDKVAVDTEGMKRQVSEGIVKTMLEKSGFTDEASQKLTLRQLVLTKMLEALEGSDQLELEDYVLFFSLLGGERGTVPDKWKTLVSLLRFESLSDVMVCDVLGNRGAFTHSQNGGVIITGSVTLFLRYFDELAKYMFDFEDLMKGVWREAAKLAAESHNGELSKKHRAHRQVGPEAFTISKSKLPAAFILFHGVAGTMKPLGQQLRELINEVKESDQPALQGRSVQALYSLLEGAFYQTQHIQESVLSALDFVCNDHQIEKELVKIQQVLRALLRGIEADLAKKDRFSHPLDEEFVNAFTKDLNFNTQSWSSNWAPSILEFLRSYRAKHNEVLRKLSQEEADTIEKTLIDRRKNELLETWNRQLTSNQEFIAKERLLALNAIQKKLGSFLSLAVPELSAFFLENGGLQMEDQALISLWDDYEPMVKREKSPPSSPPAKSSAKQMETRKKGAPKRHSPLPPTPEPLFLSKEDIFVGQLKEVRSGLENRRDLHSLTLLSNLLAEQVELADNGDSVLRTLNQEVASHLRLAAIGLENFVIGVREGNLEAVRAAYPMLLMDWHLQLEQTLDRMYYSQRGSIPYCHALVSLSQMTGKERDFSEEESRLFRELNQGMIWTRYPLTSTDISKEKRSDSLHFLAQLQQAEYWKKGKAEELFTHCTFLHTASLSFIARVYDLDSALQGAIPLLQETMGKVLVVTKDLSVGDQKGSPSIKECQSMIGRVLKKNQLPDRGVRKLEEVFAHLERSRGGYQLYKRNTVSYQAPWHYRNFMFVQWALEGVYQARLHCAGITSTSHNFAQMDALLQPESQNRTLPSTHLFYFGKGIHYPFVSSLFPHKVENRYTEPFERSLRALSHSISSEEGFQPVKGPKTDPNASLDAQDLIDNGFTLLRQEIAKFS